MREARLIAGVFNIRVVRTAREYRSRRNVRSSLHSRPDISHQFVNRSAISRASRIRENFIVVTRNNFRQCPGERNSRHDEFCREYLAVKIAARPAGRVKTVAPLFRGEPGDFYERPLCGYRGVTSAGVTSPV